ncbi:Copper binding protein, plastocyanin/azurin family [Halogranum amylolyticum]|uniref:Copper binding protein, plastocyanin/azurin family n=1 Tax=Halogranum amylolyticum TaxID=660520 RepID=A0A1H8RQ27_9EURY|nr:plastocyanin/azurin family copper-binding protein [Halogranum amylolyticum]SEO68561.1 Copper binding protein, plastocyanin/azurin family [Halogranum amylolyticum]
MDERELSDAELLELIKNHGIDRRSVMKALGVGTALSLSAGNAAAKHDDPHPPHIDSHYGYATSDADDIPTKLEPDHVVELHAIPPNPPENQPPMFHFAPSGLSVDCGDVVQFTFTAPDHTITAYHPAHGFQRRVPKQTPPFSSPVVNAGGAWLYRFETEGLYDMYCGPHHILGMAMRIVVGNLSEEDIPDYEDTFEGSEGPPPLLAPFSKEALEHELHNFTAFIEGGNEGCEWVWLTPKEILDTDALDPRNIQEGDGKVSFDQVLEDIGRADVSHEHE